MMKSEAQRLIAKIETELVGSAASSDRVPNDALMTAWEIRQVLWRNYDAPPTSGDGDRANYLITDEMVERMARALFARTTAGCNGFSWPLNGDWDRQRLMDDARVTLQRVIGIDSDASAPERKVGA